MCEKVCDCNRNIVHSFDSTGMERCCIDTAFKLPIWRVFNQDPLPDDAQAACAGCGRKLVLKNSRWKVAA